MKKRRNFFIILTILALGLVGWWYWRPQASPKAVPVVTKVKKITDPLTSQETQIINSGNITPLAKKRILADPALARQYLQALKDGKTDIATLLGSLNLSPEEKQGLQNNPDEARVLMPLLSVISARNGQSQEMYGKVIDQNGQPVVGASVEGNVLINTMDPNNSGHQSKETTTDNNGLFDITGMHGVNIGVSIIKEGYETNNGGYHAPNAQDKSSPDERATFVMWKLQGAELMVHVKFDSRIPYDGTSAMFDLFAGKKSDGGDLQITLTRNPLQVKRGQDQFAWDVKIEVLGGGLREERDAYPYVAPDSGYQPIFEFSQAQGAQNWTQSLIKTFYIHTGNDNYGRITIDLAADSVRVDGTGITIEAYMNPAPNSRNLEFNEKNVVTGQ